MLRTIVHKKLKKIQSESKSQKIDQWLGASGLGVGTVRLTSPSKPARVNSISDFFLSVFFFYFNLCWIGHVQGKTVRCNQFHFSPFYLF
jgi:hypothetical protein